jgi:4'-phosphopantetheinyl transferase EntD
MDVRELPGLFDPPVVVLTAPVDDAAVARLRPREAEAMARARAKRRREFATGRLLAREALARLGVRGFALVNGEDRAPVWPEGIAGTITHCDTRAAVAVGWRAEVGTVGLDLEHRAGLARRLWRMTLLPEEVAFLETRPAAEREAWALTLFSAKEALYKAQYPVSREYMGFSALRVELEPDATAPHGPGRLRCVFRRDVGPFPAGHVARGRYLPFEGQAVVGVRIPPGPP